MRKFARGLLWVGFILVIFELGAFASARRTVGFYNARTEFCRVRQAALDPIDRSKWTDDQRRVYESMCDAPDVAFRVLFHPILPGYMINTSLSLGAFLYLIAIIRDARKARSAGA